jgi:SAM-dependent methyltransferase
MISDWLAFWDSPHSIYANARHKDAHYRLIAQDIAALVPGPNAHVLDYGSGEALHADLVAAAAEQLFLCEASPGLCSFLEGRFVANPKIRVLAPHEVARLPERSLDLIVLHSVTQYLTAAGSGALFALFHRLLKSDGLLLVSDVVPPGLWATTDAWALLRFGAENGFLIEALRGLVRTRFSDYWRLRSNLGLTRYDEAAMIDKLTAAGFTARRTEENIGHNPARMAFLARPR